MEVRVERATPKVGVAIRIWTKMEPYVVQPLPVFGVEVRGIDLKREQPQNLIEKIKEDVTKYRLMVFREQGLISGQRQVEISQWFGELDSPFYKHPRSPHPDVFRVSNDEEEGCVGVGRTGWHVDGSFQPSPYSHSLYHIVSVPIKGDTCNCSPRIIVVYWYCAALINGSLMSQCSYLCWR